MGQMSYKIAGNSRGPVRRSEMWSSKLAICGLLVLAWARAQDEVEVATGQGKLKGIKLDTVYQKKPYFSFLGIPYTEKRLGPDRFRDPVSAGKFNGVYDATTLTPSCPFFCMIAQQMLGSEDCLYLNVFTPDLKQDAGKAVMVFFSGGGWQAGLGGDLFYGPDFLVEQDVILVTVNSRLGALGFLNTGDENAHGNMGMKDQVMALRWVQENIQHFGGCPKRVTIFGHSSGSASVQYHMISPMSQGLFKSAIMQSGTVLDPWATSMNLRDLSFELGKTLGINTGDSKDLVDKLRDAPLEDIIAGTGEMSKDKNVASGHLFQFVPGVEASKGQEVFLPTNAWELLKTGTMADIPLMIGMLSQESMFLAAGIAMQAEHVGDNYELFVPCQMNITDSSQKRQVGEMIKNYYLGDKTISASNVPPEYITMVDDQLFTAGLGMSLKIMGERKSAPIYLYLFSYESPFGIMKNIFQMDKGVAHGDELGYEFYSGYYKNVPVAGSPAEKMTRIITKLWTNFAKDDDPTSVIDNDITTKWAPRTADDNYMNINQELKMESGLFKERIDFWAGLYKDHLSN